MTRAALILTLLLAASCTRGRDAPVVEEDQSFSGLASVVQVADPKSAAQLVKGWHEVEQGSWRWTEKQFSVVLKPPAPGKPATLQLKLVLPDVLMTRQGSITLSAAADGAPLAPETYSQAGEHVYSRSFPTARDVVRIDFIVDKTLPPNDTDRRELGIVVSSVALE